MAKLFANSGDPDQTPRSAASDLGLHCLSIILLRVSRLQWVNCDNVVANNLSSSCDITFRTTTDRGSCCIHDT